MVLWIADVQADSRTNLVYIVFNICFILQMAHSAKSLRSLHETDKVTANGSSMHSGLILNYQQSAFTDEAIYSRTAVYRGQLVSVQFYSKHPVTLSRTDLIELKWVK